MGLEFYQNSELNQSFLTPQEMAGYLKVSLKTIYRMVESRAIPFYKVGHSLRFKKADVEKYLEKTLVKSMPEK